LNLHFPYPRNIFTKMYIQYTNTLPHPRGTLLNYFKALPPDPPLSPHLRRSSSIYSLATGLTPCEVDFPAPLTVPKQKSRPVYQPLLLQPLLVPLPPNPIDTNINEPYSPSSIQAEPSTPPMTPYEDAFSELWSNSSLPVPVACRLSRPFAPRIPHKQRDIIEEGLPNRFISPKRAGNTEEDTAIALSSIYQYYFAEEGETSWSQQ